MAGYDCGMTVTSGKAEPGGLRDATRRAVRAEIAAKAMDLFLEQGFEETTVNQVAAAVGMSSRSVFRYFGSKEEMVIGELVELGHEVAAALEGRPDDEGPWIALRHALQVCVDSLEGQEAGRRRATMLANTPSLRTAMLDKQMRWQEMLVPHIEGRLHVAGELGTLQARALVSTALACLDVAATAWTQPPSDRSLRDLVDVAFAAIRS
jgi:AcrR family transcriptional regulator